MKQVSIMVRAEWDEDAHVWVATSNDIDGLAVESETAEGLKDKVIAAVCDLLELNGIGELDGSLPDIPIHIMAQQTARVVLPC